MATSSLRSSVSDVSSTNSFATAKQCTYYPNVTYNTFCKSFSLVDHSGTFTTYSQLYYNTNATDSESLLYNEYDHCKPGPECDMTYTENSCPDSYAGVSTGISNNSPVATVYCCPKVVNWDVVLTTHQFVFSRVTSDFGTGIGTYPITSAHAFCNYVWNNIGTEESTMPIPTATLAIGSGGGVLAYNTLDIIAVLALSYPTSGLATSTAPSLITSSTPSSTSTSTLTSTSTTSTGIPPTHATSRSSLDTSTKAGIGVGVSIGALLLLSLIPLLIFLRRRKQKRNATATAIDQSYNKPELHGEALKKEEVAREITGVPVFEMEGRGLPVEIGHPS